MVLLSRLEILTLTPFVLVLAVSPLSLVKNPMILLAIVALVFTLGMPKLMENSMCFLTTAFLGQYLDLYQLTHSCSGSGNARRI